MRHTGVVLAVLVVLAGVPVGIVSADVVSRIAYGSPRVAVAGGPSDPDSPGARIFRSGARSDLTEIPRTVQGVPTESLTMYGCARCHGTWGRGGPVPVDFGNAYAPPITYDDLVAAGYTEAGIGAAVRTGVDSRGRMLSVLMPRWALSDRELTDLIAHLKALSSL